MPKQSFDINVFRLKTLVSPFEYKGMAVNVEQVGYIFKYNIYDPKTKNWYSSYVTDEDIVKGKCKECSQDILVKTEYKPIEIARIADHVSDMARATIDLILKKDNPEELIKDNEQGAYVAKVLEDNVKPEVKDKNARDKKQKGK